MCIYALARVSICAGVCGMLRCSGAIKSLAACMCNVRGCNFAIEIETMR